MNYIFLIILGISIGNLELLVDLLYLIFTPWYTRGLRLSMIIWFVIHPMAYGFLFMVYGLSHPNSEKSFKEKLKYIYAAPVYSALMVFRVLPFFSAVHTWFTKTFKLNHKENGMRMYSHENCF
jgi:hypothetical protein